MLHCALVFFIVASIAAVFGFTGIAMGAAAIAKILFFIFLVLFVVSLVAGLIRPIMTETRSDGPTWIRRASPRALLLGQKST